MNRLIAINSECTKSNKEIVDYILSLFNKDKRFRIVKQKIKKNNFFIYNLIIKLSGESNKNPLVFSGHTDTVPASSTWRENPLKALKIKNKIYGLGSSDMKGSLALMIYQLLNFKNKPKNDVYLILTADEEDGGLGIKKIEKTLKINNANIIIGESTEGKIRLGQKACFGYKIVLKSNGGHAACVNFIDNLKNNPLQKFVQIVNKINKWVIKNNQIHKIYGGITFNIGKISSGTNPNVIPDHAEFEIDFRFPPLKKFDNLDKIDKIIKKTIMSSCDNKQVQIFNIFKGNSFETRKNNLLVDKIRKIYKDLYKKEIVFFDNLSWTEGSVYEKFGNVIILGPGKIGQPHTSDEFVEMNSLKKVNKIYQALLNN
ncbi:M20/M25/M40 family metallo-hydrolase [Patescibacteria group bacterium]|nr:M20/M25/M40 family metallo-hydrolase [Patescibacteria group bacterium]